MTQISEQQLLDIFKELSEEDRNQLFLQGRALTPEGKGEALKIEKRIKDISARVNALIKLIENKSSELYPLLDSCISENREEDKYLGVYVFSSNNPDIPISIISGLRVETGTYGGRRTNNYYYQIGRDDNYCIGKYNDNMEGYYGSFNSSSYYYTDTCSSLLKNLEEINDGKDLVSLQRDGYSPLSEAEKYLNGDEYLSVKALLEPLTEETNELFELFSEFLNLLNQTKMLRVNSDLEQVYKFSVNTDIWNSSYVTGEIAFSLDKKTGTYKFDFIDWFTSAGSCW